MSNQNPSIISHVSIGTSQYAKARAFYDAAIAAGATCDGPPDSRRAMASLITAALSVIWMGTRLKRLIGMLMGARRFRILI